MTQDTTTDTTECEELLEEYQMLVQRLDESGFSPDESAESDDINDEFTEDDYDRLKELEKIIDKECDSILPEGDDDVDMPSFANQAPSESMDFELDESAADESAEEQSDI